MLERSVQSKYLHGSNNREFSPELFVDHKSQGSHHGGTSVVELNGTLGKLGFLVKGVPSEVKGSVAEVTNELISSSFNVLHDTKLKSSNKGNNLCQTGLRDGIRSGNGSPSIREGVEGVSGVVNGSSKVDSVSGDNLSKEGKHTNTSVLDLNISETVELFLVTVFNESKRIEESKRRLGPEFVLEGANSSGGGLLLGRGESSGGGDEGCEDSRFHFEVFI
mmetsp:Transcript_13767/g.30769  ORF Transcript_13767/g.30769 Transcript_13767/m.30769 type:complete len:220 (+) Transcript_13767:231-890(+)